MLYKDGEKYNLTKEEQKMYGGKTVFVFTPEMIKYDREDERIRRPNSIHLEPVYMFFDTATGSTSEFRFVQATRPKRDGNLSYTEYTPSEVIFPNTGKLVVENDPELNMWLQNHPAMQGSPNGNKARQPIYMVENKAEEAKKRVKAKAALYEAESLILSPTDSLSEKDLRDLCRTYPDLVGSVETFTLEQVKDALMLKAQADPQAFIRQTKDQRNRVLSIITQAKNKEMIQYIAGKRSWVLKEGGQEKDTILVVKKERDPQEAIIDHLMFDDKKGYLEYFTKAVEKKEETATVE